MKAVVYAEVGDSSVLSLVDRDKPEPGPGEVRVKIAVSGVNPTDWKSRKGFGPAAAQLGYDEIVPNHDGAGVVDSIGDGVVGVEPGDRVWVYLAAFLRPTGTAQEFTVVPAERVVQLPDNVSFDVGASLGIPAITAHCALTSAQDGPGRLRPGALDGKSVLVVGGAGAVGHAAIQLAKWAGATVVTSVSSTEKAALAAAAGAHHVVNYRTEDAEAAIRAVANQGVDLVVEVAPAVNTALNEAVAAMHATVAVYADDGGDTLTLNIFRNMILNTRYQFILIYTMGSDALRRAAEDLTAAARDGSLAVGADAGLPLHRFPLADAAAAHDAVENSAVGKILIDVG